MTAVEITVNWIFGAVIKVRTTEKNYYLGRLLWSCLKPQAGFAERENWSYTAASIALVNGCIACICSWLLVIYILDVEQTSCSYLSASDSIGEWLHDHEETTLVFFRSWSTVSSMCFHVFFDKLSNKLLWLFCLFLSFFFRWNCISSILRNVLKQFASGAVLSFAKKNLS